MDWEKFGSFTNATTTNSFYQGAINLNPKGENVNFYTWDIGKEVIDVTDSYIELESIEIKCNKCKYCESAIRKNDNTYQLLCTVGEYKKPVGDGKFKCSKFEIKKEQGLM